MFKWLVPKYPKRRNACGHVTYTRDMTAEQHANISNLTIFRQHVHGLPETCQHNLIAFPVVWHKLKLSMTWRKAQMSKSFMCTLTVRPTGDPLRGFGSAHNAATARRAQWASLTCLLLQTIPRQPTHTKPTLRRSFFVFLSGSSS